MLYVMIPYQNHNYYKALEIYTGWFDTLDIIDLLFSYPSSIIITKDYCNTRTAKPFYNEVPRNKAKHFWTR